MNQHKISLASDNWAPAHPSILEAIAQANEGVAPAYGLDPWTEEAEQLIQAEFKTPCRVLMVPTGTGANVLSLRLCCKPYESVLCTDIAHIHYQETGAAEALIGCKLLTLPHTDGKLSPVDVKKRIQKEKAFGKHSTTPRVLSLTQPTELGTIYSLKELNELAQLCKEENLLLHIDGSRLYNAAAALGTPLHEILKAASPDILSLGGTKNGLMGAESVVIFNPPLQEGSYPLQKQMLQLSSKMRYLSIQYITLFKDRLWERLAVHANQKAQELSTIIRSIPTLCLSSPVETNQIFFKAPPSLIPLIQEKIFCYLWSSEASEIRFITAWNTSDEDIRRTRLILQALPL